MANEMIPVGYPIFVADQTASVDKKFGPYPSINKALEVLSSDYEAICAGLHFGVQQADGSVKEYQFTDSNGSYRELAFVDDVADGLVTKELQAYLRHLAGAIIECDGGILNYGGTPEEGKRYLYYSDATNTKLTKIAYKGSSGLATEDCKQDKLYTCGGNVYVFDGTACVHVGASGGKEGIAASIIAPAFVSKQYVVGDIVTYNGKIYRCTTTHAAAGQLIVGYWSEVSNVVSLIPYVVSYIENYIAPEWVASKLYPKGSIVRYNGKLYIAVTENRQSPLSDQWEEQNIGALVKSLIEKGESKVDKEEGKGLSTNDFTDAYKTKLESIEGNANNYELPVATGSVLGGIKIGDGWGDNFKDDGTLNAPEQAQANWEQTNSAAKDYIKNKPINATSSKDGLMSKEDKQNLDAIKSSTISQQVGEFDVTLQFKNGNGTELSKVVIPAATQEAAGVMTKSDKHVVEKYKNINLLANATSDNTYIGLVSVLSDGGYTNELAHVALPVADESKSGVMLPSHVNAIKKLQEDITALTGLDGTNYLGIYSNVGDALTKRGEVADNEACWCLVGELDHLQLYVAQPNEGLTPFGDREYDFTDYADVKEELNLQSEKLDELSRKFPDTEEDGFYLVDKNGNVIACINPANEFDVAKLSEHIIRLIAEFLGIEDINAKLQNLAENSGVVSSVLEDGVYVTDKNGNIITRLDILDTADVSEHFVKLLNSKGLKGGSNGKDWSEADAIELPKPISMAYVNITTPRIPTSVNKDDNLDAILEYWDNCGNYFKKDITAFNIQGRSSVNFPKHNFSFDVKDGTKIRFGNWVAQDSFHLKANYIDAFRGGRNIVSYNIQQQISELNEWADRRPWRKIVKNNVSLYNGTGKQVADLATNARGIPDGFPIRLSINGEFYGLYTWNLKKHRDNMAMDKATAEHIQIDGENLANSLFNGSANIIWSDFEIRNPKNLCYQNMIEGSYKYDADVEQAEIAGIDKNYDGDWVDGAYAIGRVVKHGSDYFINAIADNMAQPITVDAAGNKNDAKNPDFKNKTKCGWVNCTLSVKVKNYIKRLADTKTSITNAETFKQYFDKDWCIDYILQVNAMMNIDVITNNTQYCTWDGNLWFPMAYDQDQCYGLYWEGNKIRGNDAATSAQKPDIVVVGKTLQTGTPMSKVFDYFKSDMDERYKELVDADILTTNNIVAKLNDWCGKIGEGNFAEEFKKWSETPSYRASGTYPSYPITGGFYDSIERVNKYQQTRELFLTNYFK